MLSVFTRLLVSAARIWRSDEGQGLTEYALILALIALVSVVALSFVGGQLTAPVSTVAGTL